MSAAHKKQNQGNNKRDIISKLPDCILQHILSFLETKQAVQTSVLSHRWMNVWIDVPNLFFNFNPFSDFRRVDEDQQPHIDSYSPRRPPYSPCNWYEPPDPNDPPPTPPPTPPPYSPGHNYDYRRATKEIKGFNKCVVDFLTKRSKSSNIDKFVLWCHFQIEQFFVDSILPHVANHNPREIEIYSDRGIDMNDFCEGLRLPHCLYTIETLEKLELGIPRLILSETHGFATIKELRLHGMDGTTEYENNERLTCPEFFTRCLVLETLSFTNCTLHFLVLTISSPKLKNLEIIDCYFKSVIISSPLLAYFKFEGHKHMIPNLSMQGDCNLLLEIDIDVRVYQPRTSNRYIDKDEEAARVSSEDNLLKMLNQLRAAQSVIMSYNTFMILSGIIGSIESTYQLFPLLKEFKLKTSWSVPENAWYLVVNNSSTSEVETSIHLFLPRLRPKYFMM